MVNPNSTTRRLLLTTRTYNQRKRFTLNQPNTYSSTSPQQK
nr:MAG TPA: hypothetical protein [Bacteriophage sp.]